jgi:transposase
MAMGKRKSNRQPRMWIATTDLPTAASHPFYARLNRLFADQRFDDFAETACAPFYAAKMGRPGLPPGIYFRLLFVGYFEGLDSERGIAWRAADSLTLRDFLGLALDEVPADHSTISRTRRLIPVETHREVFTWVLERLATVGLVKGQTIGVDATTLEANAALRSIVRRDSGESYQEFLTKLAEASGIRTPTRAALARLDRKRKKKGSNDEWTHPHDPDARITKMKDGRTHLAHKAEHAVDLDTGAIVGITVQGADQGDTTTIDQTLAETVEQLIAVEQATGEPIAIVNDLVADKGYHSRDKVRELNDVGFRTYISAGSPASGLDRSARRTRRGVRESSTDSRRARPAAGAETRGTAGAAVGAPVRNGRHAADALAWSRQHPQATAPACERLQSRALDAHGVWCRHATGLAGPRGGARRDDHGIVRVH